MNEVEQRIAFLRKSVDDATHARHRIEARIEQTKATIAQATEEMTASFGVNTTAGARVKLSELDASIEQLVSTAEAALGRTS
jgi:phage shock protein A